MPAKAGRRGEKFNGCRNWASDLGNKAWGKGRAQLLILYFSEVGAGQKYWISVFWPNGYRADDKGVKDDVDLENEDRQAPA
jgi:hypothetical protein